MNSGKTVANASMIWGGSLQNWSRALKVKAGQSSAVLGAGSLTSPGSELLLHLRAPDDAPRTQPSVEVGPERRRNEVICKSQEKVVPRLIGHLGAAKRSEGGLVNGDARHGVRIGHHYHNEYCGRWELPSREPWAEVRRSSRPRVSNPLPIPSPRPVGGGESPP